MSNAPVTLTPQDFVALVVRHRKLVLAPAAVGAVLAALSTFVFPRNWKAEQGLLIRSDAAGYSAQRLGKFTDLSEMKTVQETLLELAKSHSVVSAVLSEVGPPSWTLGTWPSEQNVVDFRDQLRLTPPGGAEFGKTEVFYIGVLDTSRDRAVKLVESLTTQLEKRMRELRGQRATSMVSEVERSVALAREGLEKNVLQLSEFEQTVGADLIELRHLTSPSGGQSELGQRSLAIESERRQSIENRRRNEALLIELRAAVNDPTRLVATPDALLTSQPALRRLKNGLVDAQLTVARTGGARTTDHPYVLAARESTQQIKVELANELPTAIAGVELELEVGKTREGSLDGELAQIQGRTAGLASKRTRYAELSANVESQTRVLEGSLKHLADARSHQAGVVSASLLARIDAVEAGVRPVGPGRMTVTMAGGMAGLVLGGALVFVLHGAPPRRGKRATDVPGGTPVVGPGGRRMTDQPLGAETAAAQPIAPAAKPDGASEAAPPPKPAAVAPPSPTPTHPAGTTLAADAESPNDWYSRLAAAAGDAPRR
ncbi:MAG: hypothetical protein ACRCT8_15410 [Lacipirellulaceae bacterium]